MRQKASAISRWKFQFQKHTQVIVILDDPYQCDQIGAFLKGVVDTNFGQIRFHDFLG